MRKSKYVIIISLLFLFTLYFYVESNSVESNAKDKHEDIIKLKEIHLKVVDRKYIGSTVIDFDYRISNQVWFQFGSWVILYFTKNSVVFRDINKYAVLPLNNIKGLDKTKSSYDIFKPGANPNVSSIIPCDSCNFKQYQDKLMMINDSSCKSDNNSNSQIQLSLLDDNGYMNKGTIKYIPCIAKERIFEYVGDLFSRYDISYDAEIYYAVVYPRTNRTDECSFLITAEDVILQGKYNTCYSISRYDDFGLPFSMSPDITKFAMVDDEYNKIRLYTFDNKSVKTNVLTDIQAKSNDTYLFLNDNGYLHVVRFVFFKTTSEVYKINDFSKPDGYTYAGKNSVIYYFFKTTSEVYKINDFSKPDGYTYAGKNSVIYYISDNGYNTYQKLLDNTLYRIYKNSGIEHTLNYVVSPDMKMAVSVSYRKDSDICDIYLHSLEPVDANEKGVENQKK